jgi:hypothetical protein
MAGLVFFDPRSSPLSRQSAWPHIWSGRRDTDDCYIAAMLVPTALITIMALSLGVIVVLVAREVAKR